MKKRNGKRSPSKGRLAHEVEGVAAGAIAGAALGAAAGPPGAVAGAVIGGAVGAIAAVALDNQAAESVQRQRTLDEEIGVIGGVIGAPNLEHPPAKVGAYSPASVGEGSSSDSAPAEGPISQAE
jgi:hypothetical protein